ncbi:MAG TPA: serine/threonine-protein kinase [Ktedonobacteraceae bacterium]
MEETSGTRFGNYELVRRIDVGGMGEVYLARQLTAFNRAVAIKIIRSDLVHDTTARARFLREAEVSAHLKHEHILPLFDFGEVEGRLYLVTPYIEGGTLATRLKTGGPLTLAETRALFVPLVQAVAYIHRRGVVHRDLKPTNIMLDTEDGQVYMRLIDFGIATLQGRTASPPLTTAGHEMGTVAYMAPERLSGVAAPSNDIFSLGVILHQMLTGRVPTAAVPAPNSVVPRLAEPLAQVIRAAIASNPNQRYGSAEDLLKGFEQACKQLEDPTPKTPLVSDSTVPATSNPEQSAPRVHSELVSLAHSGELPALVSQTPQVHTRPQARLSFAPEDYDAPTTSFQQPRPVKQLPNSRTPLMRPRPPRPPKAPRGKPNTLVVTVSIITVLVLLAFAGVLYYGYQFVNATSVTINFSPRTQVISQVISMKADPKASAINLAQAIIPARALTSQTVTRSQAASTTGRVNCVLGSLGCQPGVSQEDVNNLIAQMQPSFDQSIKQKLDGQLSSRHATQLGSINITITNAVSSPPVGQPGKTVTVTLSEQGSVGYFLNADATKVADQDVANAVSQLGQGYHLVDATLHIDAFKLQSIDPVSGVSTISASEGAVARYQFTPENLQAISQGLVGKSLAAARTFLQNQPGIDPASVQINFTAGSDHKNMPTDVTHIKLIPLDPSSLPNIPLTPVSGVTSTPIDPTPVSPATATPTDGGNQ